MTGRTTLVRRAVARAGTRGLAHLAHQADTGTWISMCGRQVRGQAITAVDGPAAPAHVVELGSAFCPACVDLAHLVADDLAAGVAVLLRTAPAGTASRLLEVPVDRIDTAPDARRADLELVSAVAASGLVVPLVLRADGDRFELVDGARRLDAARSAGLATVPAVVRELDAADTVLARLLANLHRVDLDPIAQGRAYRDALAALECTPGKLAARLGVSREQVANTVRLLELPDELAALLVDGTLSAAHGRALLRFPTGSAEQADAAALILREGLTTRQADELARAAVPAPAARAASMGDLAAVLERLLRAQVRVTTSADRARVTVSVAPDELPALLERLGVHDLEPAAELRA